MAKSNYIIEYTILNMQQLITFLVPTNTKQYPNRQNKDEYNGITI